MEPLNLISSLNKISLLAFLITLGFIIYQFYLLKKEVSTKKGKPNIPAFNDQTPVAAGYTKVIIDDKAVASFKKPNRLPLIVGGAFLAVFGIVFFIGVVNKEVPGLLGRADNSITPMVNLVASKGIEIFDENWSLLTNEQLATMSAGTKLYIGIATIGETDIDRARIRINSAQWTIDDIVMALNKDKNVYYREYTIPSGDTTLKIQAQLHSAADGWLGD